MILIFSEASGRTDQEGDQVSGIASMEAMGGGGRLWESEKMG